MLDIVRATSIRHIGHAAALRYDAYVGTMPTKGIANAARREITPHDVLERTHHLIAYDGHEPVGTLRAILPRSCPALEGETPYGLSMEDHVSFVFIAPGMRFCEVGRLAIRPDYRGTDVMRRLYKALCDLLEENEVGYFGGLSLMNTNSLSEASRCFDVIEANGWCTRDIWVSSIKAPQPSDPGQEPVGMATVYEEITDHPALASLPGLVRYYLRTGFRVCGRPFYDDRYDGCFLPMVSTPSGLRSVRFAGRTIMD